MTLITAEEALHHMEFRSTPTEFHGFLPEEFVNSNVLSHLPPVDELTNEDVEVLMGKVGSALLAAYLGDA